MQMVFITNITSNYQYNTPKYDYEHLPTNHARLYGFQCKGSITDIIRRLPVFVRGDSCRFWMPISSKNRLYCHILTHINFFTYIFSHLHSSISLNLHFSLFLIFNSSHNINLLSNHYSIFTFSAYSNLTNLTASQISFFTLSFSHT